MHRGKHEAGDAKCCLLYTSSDRALGGSDTWATSNAIAAGIRKIGDFDILFAGRQAIDGDTAQVGPQIAEKLGVPQVTYVKEFELEKDRIVVKRALENLSLIHILTFRQPERYNK